MRHALKDKNRYISPYKKTKKLPVKGQFLKLYPLKIVLCFSFSKEIIVEESADDVLELQESAVVHESAAVHESVDLHESVDPENVTDHDKKH